MTESAGLKKRPGGIYEQAVVKSEAVGKRDSSKHLFGIAAGTRHLTYSVGPIHGYGVLGIRLSPRHATSPGSGH